MTSGLRGNWLMLVALGAGIALALYGLFEARFLIEGPVIVLEAPRSGSAVAGPLIHITGEARNIAFLTIDGAQAYTDQSGRFDKIIAPPPGYTVVEVAAKDRFGRTAVKTARLTVVNYCPLS